VVKLKSILSEVLSEDFGDVAFGEKTAYMSYSQINGILQLQKATKQEPNTEEEKELFSALWSWVYNGHFMSANTIYSFESLIRKYMNKFPSVLKPKTKNGTFLYRGIKDPSPNIIEMFENFGSYDLEEVSIENKLFFKVKRKINLTHHRAIQSWSSDFSVVYKDFLSKQFPFFLRTKQNKEFLFNQKFLHTVYENKNEFEVLHFGVEYSNEVEVFIGVNFIKSIGREDILREISPYTSFGLSRNRIIENADGSIDYDGDVDFYDMKLKEIPFNFRKVSGRFNCSLNQLTSLKGAPKEVGGNFNCSYSKLTSLKGAPKEVGGDFDCSGNKLKTLEGSPKKVGGDFLCSRTNIISLERAPEKVGGDFDCSDNNLTSLKGAPKEVGGGFYCNSNNLTSLEGSPEKVTGIFRCSSNNLTSLKGAPKEVGGDFYCSYNKPPFSRHEKKWAKENIKARRFEW